MAINLVSPEKEKSAALAIVDGAPTATDAPDRPLNDVDRLDCEIAQYRRKMVSHDSAMEMIKSVCSFF